MTASPPPESRETNTPAPASDGPTLVAKLSVRPGNFPDRDVRAALVWVDGYDSPSCTELSCGHLRDHKLTVTSDKPIDVTFPLTVRLAVELTEPTAVKPFRNEPPDSPFWPVHDTEFYSLPQAEVVVYVDGNHNQKLDLLPPGQPGPGPDRMLALSSGQDALGNTVRSAVINKRGPVDLSNELILLPGLDVLQIPLPAGFPGGQSDARAYPDGAYVLKSSASGLQPFAGAALLKSHGLYNSASYDGGWDSQLLQNVISDIQPLASAEISLFAVTPEEKTWLARGCEAYPIAHGDESVPAPPPAGAEVLCGAGTLFYATNPGDYCGQTQYVVGVQSSDPEHPTLPDWWPCDAHGLKADAPYVAATSRFDTDMLLRHNAFAITGTMDFTPPTDYVCEAAAGILDLDRDPTLHLPSMAPPAGSQVMCYGPDALSFVPDSQCLTKFTYDLSSSTIPGYPTFFPSWDVRDERPDWWPCDADGKLIADRGYVEPAPFMPTFCPPPLVKTVSPYYAPPPHSYITCQSPTQLTVAPLWADSCDNQQVIASVGSVTVGNQTSSWSGGEPLPGWPCDANGKFIPMDGYLSGTTP